MKYGCHNSKITALPKNINTLSQTQRFPEHNIRMLAWNNNIRFGNRQWIVAVALEIAVMIGIGIHYYQTPNHYQGHNIRDRGLSSVRYDDSMGKTCFLQSALRVFQANKQIALYFSMHKLSNAVKRLDPEKGPLEAAIFSFGESLQELMKPGLDVTRQIRPLCESLEPALRQIKRHWSGRRRIPFAKEYVRGINAGAHFSLKYKTFLRYGPESQIAAYNAVNLGSESGAALRHVQMLTEAIYLSVDPDNSNFLREFPYRYIEVASSSKKSFEKAVEQELKKMKQQYQRYGTKVFIFEHPRIKKADLDDFQAFKFIENHLENQSEKIFDITGFSLSVFWDSQIHSVHIGRNMANVWELHDDNHLRIEDRVKALQSKSANEAVRDARILKSDQHKDSARVQFMVSEVIISCSRKNEY